MLEVSQPQRQRFRSLSTSLPDVEGNKPRFNLPFNVFSSFDPTDEITKNEKDEEKDKGKSKKTRTVTSGVQRFRSLVKSIMVQNRWTKFSEKKVADDQLMLKLKEMEDHSNPDVLTFNPGAFRSSTSSQQALSMREKRILCLPPWKRNEEDLQYVYKKIEHMMVFKRFPPLVKQELAKSLHYEAFEDGRIIIQQGHLGLSLYFVIKGSVAVEVSTTDKVTGKVFKQIVNEIMAGGSFGEMALMSGMARAATVICMGNSEFLRIDKSDFQEVLMRSYHKEWERKLDFMKICPIFQDWSPKELKAASTTTTITEYLNNKVIIQDVKQHRGSIYIIVSGTCSAVSKIKVLKETLPYGKERIRMLSSHGKKTETTRFQKTKDLFLVIRKLGCMDCFGVGEDLENTSIISQNKVEVLVIPTVHLLRHARGHCLEEIRENEMKKYPCLKEAFETYQNQRQWNNYKDELRQQILLKKSNRNARFRETLNDVWMERQFATKKKAAVKKRIKPCDKKLVQSQSRIISPFVRKRRISPQLGQCTKDKANDNSNNK